MPPCRPEGLCARCHVTKIPPLSAEDARNGKKRPSRCPPCLEKDRVYRREKVAKRKAVHPQANRDVRQRTEERVSGEDCELFLDGEGEDGEEHPPVHVDTAESRENLYNLFASALRAHHASVDSHLRCRGVDPESEEEILARASFRNPMDFCAHWYPPPGELPPSDITGRIGWVRQLAKELGGKAAQGIYHFRELYHTKYKSGSIRIVFTCCQDASTPPPTNSKTALREALRERHSANSYEQPNSSHPSANQPHGSAPWLPQIREGNVGMDRYPCQSQLVVRYSPRYGRVYVRAKHIVPHIAYCRNDVPTEVWEALEEYLRGPAGKRATPQDLISLIRHRFSGDDYEWISTSQLRNRITEIVNSPHRLDKDPVTSARLLLQKHHETGEVVYLDMPDMPGITAIAFGFKRVLDEVKRKKWHVDEIYVDATFGTNSDNLELYAIVLDVDSGIPAFYLALETKRSLTEANRTSALKHFFRRARDYAGLKLKIVHLDKDWAEITAATEEFPEGKVMLCYWHVRDAIKSRLRKLGLSTRGYDPYSAHEQFDFIDINFVSTLNGDPTSSAFSVQARAPRQSQSSQVAATRVSHSPATPSGTTSNTSIPSFSIIPTSSVSDPRSAVRYRIVPRTITNSQVDDHAGPPVYLFSTFVAQKALSRDLRAILGREGIPIPPNSLKPDLVALFNHHILPTRQQNLRDRYQANDSDATFVQTRETFCPEALVAHVLQLIENAFHCLPDVPTVNFKSPEAIYEESVRALYKFCYENRLPALWAYLWSNWYEPGRWDLWARSAFRDCMPLNKTNMAVERHFGVIKDSHLSLGKRPRLDTLFWKLFNELQPFYVRKLSSLRRRPGGRTALENMPWRKRDFWNQMKSHMKDHREGKIILDERYTQDLSILTCICPSFVRSPHFFCKHLYARIQLWSIENNSPVDWRRFCATTHRRRSPPFHSTHYLPSLESPSSDLGESSPEENSDDEDEHQEGDQGVDAGLNRGERSDDYRSQLQTDDEREAARAHAEAILTNDCEAMADLLMIVKSQIQRGDPGFATFVNKRWGTALKMREELRREMQAFTRRGPTQRQQRLSGSRIHISILLLLNSTSIALCIIFLAIKKPKVYISWTTGQTGHEQC